MNAFGSHHAQLSGLLVAVSLAMLSACGGGSSSPPPPLHSIAVAPNAASIPQGSTQQFKATGTYSDNTTADLTTKVSWSSASPNVGTVNASSGLAEAVAPFGSTVITAKLGSVSGTATLNVYPVLIRIDITLNPADLGENAVHIGVGVPQQLRAIGTYSDESMTDVTREATWGSSAPSVATVDSTGQVTGISLGMSTITASVANAAPVAPTTGSTSLFVSNWVPTGSMSNSRSDHTATLLPNGRVLVAAGGVDAIGFPSAEVYDPSTGTWSATGSLSSPRRTGFTATLLPNGKVLVVGGFAGGTTTLSSAELYDPSTGSWSATGSLPTKLCGHTATLLPNGKVLVAGGSNDFSLGPTTSAAELYDPVAGTWSPTGSLITARESHSASLLPNGNVLVVGGVGVEGYLSSAELYDPLAGTWSATGSLPIATGNGQTVALLSNGQVLVAGGQNSTGYLSSAELYDANFGTWTLTGSLSAARTYHTATPLPNGKVLVAGGRPPGAGASAETYDPVTGTWSPTGNLVTGRAFHSATILPDGAVLVAGGVMDNIPDITASAELYWSPK